MGEYATTRPPRSSRLRRIQGRLIAGVLMTGLWLPSMETKAQDLSVEDAQALLEGQSVDEVQMGLEALGLRGDAAAVAPIANRIRQGLPPALLEFGIATLGTIGRPEAGPVLLELLQHRRSEVRRAAAEALQQCRVPNTAAALRGALDDSDAQVRSSAAQALGSLGSRGLGSERGEVIEALFAAFDRGMLEAAPALGQLVSGEGIDRLQAYLGRRPLDVLTPAFDALFARQDIPANRRVALVGALAELATAEVAEYLDGAAMVFSGPVAQAARRAAEEIGR